MWKSLKRWPVLLALLVRALHKPPVALQLRPKFSLNSRCRLVGMPTGAGSKINIVPPADLPYVAPVVRP